MKIKILLYLTVIITIPVSLLAAEDTRIQKIAGNFTHNNSVTISGSLFGSKVPAAPYFFDDFENGSNSQQLNGNRGTVGTPRWINSGNGAIPVYSNSNSYGRGNLAAYKQSDGNDFGVAGINGLNSPTVYLSYRYRWRASGTNWEKAVFKLARITAAPGWYTDQPRFKTQCNPGSSWCYDGFDTCPNNTTDTAQFLSQNTWHRAEMYMELSSGPTSGDGVVHTRHDLRTNFNLRNARNVSSGCTANALDSFILPFDVANNSAQTYTFWADNVYFDVTRKRVEIGNNSTFESCSRRDIQIPEAWSNTSITITVNQGSFSVGEKAWVFVIDENDVASPGFEVTIGDNSSSLNQTPELLLTEPTQSPYTIMTSDDQETIEIRGTATDDVGIQTVSYSTNTGLSGTANSVDGFTSWSVPLTVSKNETVTATIVAKDTENAQTSTAVTIICSGIDLTPARPENLKVVE
jgi:hypothetical protein